MKQHTSGFLKLVAEVKQHINETNVDKVKARLDSGEQFHLLDVRDQHEWEQGHLPQATHLSKGLIECNIEKIIPDHDADIVLYCGGGFRSALAAENLQRMGYHRVTSMDGGFRGWVAAGNKIVND